MFSLKDQDKMIINIDCSHCRCYQTQLKRINDLFLKPNSNFLILFFFLFLFHVCNGKFPFVYIFLYYVQCTRSYWRNCCVFSYRNLIECCVPAYWLLLCNPLRITFSPVMSNVPFLELDRMCMNIFIPLTLLFYSCQSNIFYFSNIERLVFPCRSRGLEDVTHCQKKIAIFHVQWMNQLFASPFLRRIDNSYMLKKGNDRNRI